MTNRLRPVAILLFASLAANLFLGGIMIGRWLDPHGFGRPPHPHFERGPREPGEPPSWLRRALGPEDSVTLEDVWRRHAPEIEPLRDEMRRARDAVSEALAAEPFDAAAYAGALAAMQDRATRLFDAINTAMVDVAENLTPEQRRRVVEQSREWQQRKSGS